MINIEKARNEFLEYTKKYDINSPAIQRKIEHSLRTMDVMKELAENLKLSEENVKLASLIGLLHDIGRFEQWKRFETYMDLISIDHGDMGAYILQKDNYIRKFIETDKYDNIILEAIKNHNKYIIDEELENNEEFFTKMIRDADKLDIFYQITEKFSGNKEEIENSYVSETYMNQLENNILICTEENETALDQYVLKTSFIFDFYFNFSIQTVRRENYINRFFRKMNFKNKKTEEQIKRLLYIAETYLAETKLPEEKLINN